MYMQFLSFIRTKVMQVVEIRQHWKQRSYFFLQLDINTNTSIVIQVEGICNIWKVSLPHPTHFHDKLSMVYGKFILQLNYGTRDKNDVETVDSSFKIFFQWKDQIFTV